MEVLPHILPYSSKKYESTFESTKVPPTSVPLDRLFPFLRTWKFCNVLYCTHSSTQYHRQEYLNSRILELIVPYIVMILI